MPLCHLSQFFRLPSLINEQKKEVKRQFAKGFNVIFEARRTI